MLVENTEHTIFIFSKKMEALILLVKQSISIITS